MTVEFYDLAQRLYAAHAGHPVLRVAQPLFTAAPDAVFVEAHRTGDQVRATVAGANRVPVTAVGDAAVMALLHAAGARFDNGDLCQLVIAEASVMAALVSAARVTRNDADRAVAEASAVIGWWQDRTGYPGTGAVIDLLAHSRQRFVTGAEPTAERAVAHWRRAFGVADGVEGLAAWAGLLSRGEPIASLEAIAEDDRYTYLQAGKRFAEGNDWTAPDSAPVAAIGLRRRCNAADLWESVLLEDRLWRHRAVHTGHVAGGVVTAGKGTKFTLACARMDTRLREGTQVRGWLNGVDSFERAWPFSGEVAATEAVDGVLYLTVAGVRVDSQPSPGEWVSLMPAAPNSQRVRSGLFTYRRLLTGSDSWIAAGKTPGVSRREVPFDVLIATADTE